MVGTSENSAGVATALNVPSSAASGRIVAAEPAEGERDRHRRLGQRRGHEQAAAVDPVRQRAGGRRQQRGRRPHRDEERRDHEAGAAHRAQLQVERQERKPVAQRGHADRCGQDGEVTPAVRHLHEAADSTIVTMATTIGVLHPGEMGAAVAAALRSGGHDVVWASEGRGDATAARASEAGLRDLGSADALAAACDVVISVCPPGAAADVAATMRGFAGTYVDANAVSPGTARAIGAAVEAAGATFVDGGIVGAPPRRPGTTRLYLSGPSADAVAALFAGTALDAPVVSERVGDASAVKMAYAAWTKGTAALVLAVRETARAEGVEDALVAEWARSLPGLADEHAQALRSAGAKGWRWVAEMEEIAATFAAAGQPDGFHRAAAEIYRRY